jgi:acetyl/propionyl-CoA carboxylase alpha subunit
LDEIKASPFEEIVVRAPHTGVVEFVQDKPGVKVVGPGGQWKEKPGTLLVRLEREGNKKPIYASRKGIVERIEHNLAGKFVQAGTPLLAIRHFLSKEEVLDRLLRKSLFLFPAPERAKYFFIPDVDIKVTSKGCQSVEIRSGQELFIVSRMKRETQLNYSGPDGIIYAVYFETNQNVDAGAPLIGVCSRELLPTIQEVVGRVHSEWVEEELEEG